MNPVFLSVLMLAASQPPPPRFLPDLPPEPPRTPPRRHLMERLEIQERGQAPVVYEKTPPTPKPVRHIAEFSPEQQRRAAKRLLQVQRGGWR